MEVSRIPTGRNPPDGVMIVEIPKRSDPVKYERDDELYLIPIERFFATTLRYPGHHAFIPSIPAKDGDRCDVLLVGEPPLSPGMLVRCRPLGALLLRGERGPDNKIVVAPVDDLNPLYGEARSYADLPRPLLRQIENLFALGNDFAVGKCASPAKWGDAAAARELIADVVARAQPVSRRRLRRSA